MTTNSGWTYHHVKVMHIHDADTVQFEIDCGMGVFLRPRMRFRNINAPELHTDAGKIAKTRVEQLLLPYGRDPAKVRLHTFKMPQAGRTKTGSRGRYLCEVWYLGTDGLWHDLEEQLYQEGYARKYEP